MTKRREKEGMVAHHQKLEEDDVDEHFKILTEKQGDTSVYFSKGCGPELFIVVHMIVMTLHLIFQCLVLLLSAKIRKLLLMQ